MTTPDNNNDLYEVILIYSGVGYAAICPGILGAVSQGVDRQDTLAMIADAMATCRVHPLPGKDDPARQAELREIGKAKIAQLVAECERDGWQYELHHVAAQLITITALSCAIRCAPGAISTRRAGRASPITAGSLGASSAS